MEKGEIYHVQEPYELTKVFDMRRQKEQFMELNRYLNGRGLQNG